MAALTTTGRTNQWKTEVHQSSVVLLLHPNPGEADQQQLPS